MALYYSVDNCINWIPIVCDLEDVELFSVKSNVDASILIAVGMKGEVRSLYRSDDSGATWEDLEIFGTYSFSDDVIKIVVGGIGGLYLSTDSGESFELVSEENVADCKISNDGLKIFVAVGGASSKIITSIDDGETWQEELPAAIPLVFPHVWKCIDCSEDGKVVITGYIEEEP